MTTALTLDPSQLAAVELAREARFAVITGGPGTGKSTTLRTVLDALDAEQQVACPRCLGSGLDAAALDTCPVCAGTGHLERYLLAAPTGKAARRMEEATGRPSRTVHRLLEFGPLPLGGMGFRRGPQRTLATSAVFVDESSMLDVELASSLLAAIDPRSTRLVLIGDAHQLPSVGPGRVFADLIESGRVPVARLTTLHRAAAESWVCSQAPRVLAGEQPDLRPRADFAFGAREDRAAAVDHVVEIVAARWTIDRPQLLVPQNVGPAGADVLNARLQRVLNPNGRTTWKVRDVELRVGDPVIQTSNNYQLGVMNGETGTVAGCDDDGLFVDVDGRRVVYDRDSSWGLRLAYALTVHKSQGSEWPWVVVLAHSTHTRMLTRQLLYTAITRAKRGVVLIGDRKGLDAALRQTRDADRNTGLRDRIEAAARRAEGSV